MSSAVDVLKNPLFSVGYSGNGELPGSATRCDAGWASNVGLGYEPMEEVEEGEEG